MPSNATIKAMMLMQLTPELTKLQLIILLTR